MIPRSTSVVPPWMVSLGATLVAKASRSSKVAWLVASGSMKYLLRKLRAHRFASIDPEEFYDFTETRPTTKLRTPWQRDVRWPRNEFHYHVRRGEGPDFLLFLGREPNLRWRTYIDIVLGLAERCGVSPGRRWNR